MSNKGREDDDSEGVTNIKMFVAEIMSLSKNKTCPTLHWMGNFKVRNVQIVGTVVSVTRKTKFDMLRLDDGSGVVDCIRWVKDLKSASEKVVPFPNLGDCVSVCGSLRYPSWRGSTSIREIVIDSLKVVKDPNFEPLFWLQILQLRRDVFRFRPGLAKNTTSGRSEYAASSEVCVVDPLLKDVGNISTYLRTYVEKTNEDSADSSRTLLRIKFEILRASCDMPHRRLVKSVRRLVKGGILLSHDERDDSYAIDAAALLSKRRDS